MRNDECAGRTPAAAYSPPQTCPDVLFSDGSTRTVAGLLACIDEWKSFPCDQLRRGLDPACVTPGTRAPGQSCKFPSQCASLQCQLQTGCGMCLQTVGEGATCGTNGPACEFGLQCSSGKCIQYDPATPPPAAPQGKPVGAPCTGTSDCMAGDYCDDVTGGTNFVCTHLPAIGQMCTHAGQYCADNAYCDDTHNTCAALPTAGQACGLVRGSPAACASGTFCDMSSGTATCNAPPKVGEVCVSGGPVCAPGTICSCPVGSCAQKHCLAILEVGAACGDAGNACPPGSECSGGVCAAIDSQGLFAAACGM
jgi:hypothetical protein